MTRIVLELTMSLDGCVAGPDVRPDEPLGRGGEALHDWMFAGRSAAEAEAGMLETYRTVGAVIVGRRMADLGIPNWGDEPVFRAPVFVVTHRRAERIERRGGTSYTFVTDGFDAALRLAVAAAGDRDVMIAGGAEIARLALAAGAVDELRLHLAPIVLGGGTRLFEAGSLDGLRLRAVGAVAAPLATHLTFGVGRDG